MLDDALVQRSTNGCSTESRKTAAGQRVARRSQSDVDGIADRARRVAEHTSQVESVTDPQGCTDFVCILRAELVTGTPCYPMQFGTYIEQTAVRKRETTTGRFGAEPGHPVGQLGDGERVEQLDIAQPSSSALEVGFGAMGDLAAAGPPRSGLCDEIVETRPDAGTPLTANSADQEVAQLDVTCDVTSLEHSQSGREIGGCNVKCLWDRADAVIELDVRVPEGVPECVGDACDDLGVHVVVQQDQVEIRVRKQLTSRQPAHSNDSESRVGLDAEFGALGGEPEFVQVDQCPAKRGRVESAVACTTVEQLLPGTRQVGCGIVVLRAGAHGVSRCRVRAHVLGALRGRRPRSSSFC